MNKRTHPPPLGFSPMDSCCNCCNCKIEKQIVLKEIDRQIRLYNKALSPSKPTPDGSYYLTQLKKRLRL